jgi:hypothetical protein
MGNTIEYLAVTQASNRANRHANKVAAEAAGKAYSKAYSWDESVYDPDGRSAAITKAENAAEAAREHAFTEAWQPAYDRFLAEEYKRLSPSVASRPSASDVPAGEARTFSEPLSPNSERRF